MNFLRLTFNVGLLNVSLKCLKRSSMFIVYMFDNFHLHIRAKQLVVDVEDIVV